MSNDNNKLDNWFTYHIPKGGDIETYQIIRDAGKEFAKILDELVPDSREKEIGMERIREAVMWANAGVACAKDNVPNMMIAKLEAIEINNI